ncbi:hypothetical protein K8T06_15650, partial [bacterium]|nr:hypothetical protein [bacterium]
MSKKLNFVLIAFLVTFIVTGTNAANWITQNDPVVQVTDSRWDAIEIDVSLDGLKSQDVKTKGGTFTRLTLENEAFKGEIGAPRLPVIRKMVEVPYGADIELGFTTNGIKTLDLGQYQLLPVQAPVPKLAGALEAAPFDMNKALYSQERFLSQPEVRIEEIAFMRGHRIVVLEISPVAYNPVSNQLLFADSFAVKLELSGSDRELTQQMDYRYYNNAYEILLQDKVINHTAYRGRDYTFPPTAPVSYLIVTLPDYTSALAPFVEWKTIEGYEVVIEEISVGASTTDVKAVIQNAYDTWVNPPAYVLLNGDTDSIPAFSGEGSGSADDLQYAELEGGEYYTPDVMLGRFPIRSTTDLENIIAKTLQWEQTSMPDTDYFKDAVFIASSDHADMLEGTHEYCWDNHVYPYDTTNNLYHDVYERLGGSTSDFASNVNSGRSFVCYSGHGYGDGSGTASVHFVHSDVTALTNTDKYTHVMVFACGTNLHDQEISWGERWLIEPNKGSVTFWGTSDSSYWDEDDWEQRELFRIQDENTYYSISSLYLAGLIEVYVQSSSTNSAYYFDIYNLMGDPSAVFHGMIPMVPTITAAASTTPNPQDFPVNIADANGPTQYALVSIYSDGVLLGSAYTDVNGDALVHIEPTSPGDAIMTVTGQNIETTQQGLMIMAAGCGVIFLDRTGYNCDDIVFMQLFDADLNADPGVVEVYDVDIASDSEPVAEIVTLTETGPDTAEFVGSILTSDTQGGFGYLLVSDGDVITLHYHDVDCEGSFVDVYDYAGVDCSGPTITGTTISDVTIESAIVSWDTEEESTTVLYWGTTTPPVNMEVVPGMATEHVVSLTGLDTCTEYFFYVVSVDAHGNEAVDDNGGAYYNFTTLQLMVMLEANMDTNPGWTYEGQWAWGVPLGSGGDPTAGQTGDNVVGYNLSGSYGNGMMAEYVTTSGFDCSGASQTYLSFYKWLGVESSTFDHATLEISGDAGTSWDVIWENSAAVSGGAWEYVEFDVTPWAAGNSDVRLRWSMGPTDGSVVYCGWNIDDVMVSYTAPCNVPILTYESHIIDDSLGNNDGEINGGE